MKPLTRTTAFILAGLIIVVMLVVGWAGDSRSCQRQAGAREGTRLLASTAAAKVRQDSLSQTGSVYNATVARAEKYERAARDARALQCGGLLPDTH